MRKWLMLFMTMITGLALLAACSTDQPGSSDKSGNDDNNDDGDIKIGLSISTLNNPFFVDLKDGAEQAAEEEGYELLTSDAQDDSSTQLDDVNDMLQQDIDILLINPTDSDAVISAVEAANDADVPVITVDRSAEGGDVETHIASDNVDGGEMAGDFIAEQLADEGNLVELEGVSGASATRERGEGFHNIVDDIDGLEVVANQTADFDRTDGLSVMENIIQGTDDIDAVFAHNDEMALGALEALEAQGLEDKVVIVGFDATDDAVDAVEEGRMDATIAQQPKNIGEESIKAASKVTNGESLDDFLPVDLELVTE